MGEQGGQVTALLQQWSRGDGRAREQLFPIVYNELRRLAQYHLHRERNVHTLQSTALVHEVYVRLCRRHEPRWEDRAHFFAVSARMMRSILVDHARRQSAGKRGGQASRAPLEDALTIPVPENIDLLMLEEALERLDAFDSRKCQVVEMRFFGGLEAKQIAVVLGTTEATVRRDWIIAKAWLYRYLEGSARP